MDSMNLQSVSFPAKTTSSSPAHEKIVNALTDRYPVSSPATSPIISVSSPAKTTPSMSLITSVSYPAEATSLLSPIREQVVNESTVRYSPDRVGFSDESGGGCKCEGLDSGGGKKAVWSKPSRVVEVVSPAMDAASWPALGESTKAACSSSSSESLQALDDGLLMPALQVTVNSSSNTPATANPASTPNHVTHSEQRSMRRGGGIVGVQQSPARQASKVESVHDTYVKPATVLDSDPKDHTYKGPPRSGNDHHYQRNAYKRGYSGQHPRFNGSFHPNYGGKLDHGRGRGQGQGQGRGYQEWNQHRNFNRDNDMQSQRGGYILPSAHNSTPFIHPPMALPVPPFGSNVLYPDVAPGMIYFPAPPPPLFPGQLYFPVQEPLNDKIMKQIDFYFSNDNLVKDTYLRRHMDEQGWVPVKLIASFNKVSFLTDNVQLILNVMQNSTVVEVQGDKMRRRNDWMRWLMPQTVQDSLGSQLKNIQLDVGLQLPPGGSDRAPVA